MYGRVIVLVQKDYSTRSTPVLRFSGSPVDKDVRVWILCMTYMPFYCSTSPYLPISVKYVICKCTCVPPVSKSTVMHMHSTNCRGSQLERREAWGMMPNDVFSPCQALLLRGNHNNTSKSSIFPIQYNDLQSTPFIFTIQSLLFSILLKHLHVACGGDIHCTVVYSPQVPSLGTPFFGRAAILSVQNVFVYYANTCK